jgi:isoleucyl-tRNA synthetase
MFERKYPADFICEAIDQTRGWFYTLMAVGTLVFDQSSYRTVLCLGHILDDDGRKMSKHLGNILEPIPLMDDHGADAVRWFMLAAGSPWQARRVGHAAIAEVVRRTLLTYWNTVSFQSLYARTAGFTPDPATAPDVTDRPVLDRWALAEASRLAAEVTDALDHFDTQRAGRLLAAFIDDLSNWYVRRSRRRFWEGDPAALHTLHECLRTLTLLMAPFTPFVTERVWQDLFAADSRDSVHLQDWPDDSAALADPELADQVALIRRLVELGRGARAEGRVRTRQPLGRALVSAPGWDRMPAELRDQLADELNVVSVVSLGGGTEDATTDELVHVSVKANFRSLGRRYGKGTQAVAAAIGAADPVALTTALRGTGSATVVVAGAPETIGLDDVVITETPREGWAVATDAGETLALDLHLTPELVRRGLAREVVRMVQEGRKSAGLDVSDRIELWLTAGSPELDAALDEHTADIASEVLAVSVARDGAPADAFSGTDDDLGMTFALRRA